MISKYSKGTNLLLQYVEVKLKSLMYDMDKKTNILFPCYIQKHESTRTAHTPSGV